MYESPTTSPVREGRTRCLNFEAPGQSAHIIMSMAHIWSPHAIGSLLDSDLSESSYRLLCDLCKTVTCDWVCVRGIDLNLLAVVRKRSANWWQIKADACTANRVGKNHDFFRKKSIKSMFSIFQRFSPCTSLSVRANFSW